MRYNYRAHYGRVLQGWTTALSSETPTPRATDIRQLSLTNNVPITMRPKLCHYGRAFRRTQINSVTFCLFPPTHTYTSVVLTISRSEKLANVVIVIKCNKLSTEQLRPLHIFKLMVSTLQSTDLSLLMQRTWRLTKKVKTYKPVRRKNAYEIYGPVSDRVMCKIRRNQQLINMLNRSVIIKEIRNKRFI